MRGQHTYRERGTVHSEHRIANEDDDLVIGLIPGLGASSKLFLLVAEALEKLGLNSTLLEPPGFGDCNPQDEGFPLEEVAKVVLDDPTALRGKRIIYVGHSAGIFAATELAIADERRAIGLGIIGGPLDDIGSVLNQPKRAWRQPRRAAILVVLLGYIMGWLPKFLLGRMETPGSIFTLVFWPMIAKPRKLSREALCALTRHNRYRNAWQQLKANRRYRIASRGCLVNIPLLVVYGKHDPLITHPKNSVFIQECSKNVPDPNIVELDASHCLPVEAPEELAHHLARFAASLR